LGEAVAQHLGAYVAFFVMLTAYPLLGLVGGLGQGIYVTLISTFIITDFHPVTSYRQAYPLILSFLVGHMVYGVVVMFQHQLLQLLLP
jgi:zinc transporter ZupT